MDKIKKYKKILEEILKKHATIPYANAPEMESRLVINKSKTQFVLIKMGWFRKEFKHGIIFHFEIKNEKVWLYKNNTDIEIGERLVEKGIPKSDIVIGFVSEFERTTEGYALA